LGDSFIRRHLGDVIETRSTPAQEEQSLHVPRTFPETTVQDLNETVHGYVRELNFDLDEVGLSDLDDRKTKRAIAPS
jgi:hypothetical protein